MPATVVRDHDGQPTAAVEGSGGACVAPGSDPCVADLMKVGAMATGPIWIQLGLVSSAWFLYLHRQIHHCQLTRGDFWVYPASGGHLGLKSRAWWWWLTLPSELVGRSIKGGGPRVPLVRRWRSS
jgi:hypothetical protein